MLKIMGRKHLAKNISANLWFVNYQYPFFPSFSSPVVFFLFLILLKYKLFHSKGVCVTSLCSSPFVIYSTKQNTAVKS